MNWTIEYYATAEGKSPARDFVDSLSPESKAKYIFIADLLEEYGIGVKEPYVKSLTGSRKLFEIRIKDKNNIHRILYFTFTGKRFVLLQVLQKRLIKHQEQRLRQPQNEWMRIWQEGGNKYDDFQGT